MDEPALESQQANAESLHALASQYLNRHRNPENYFLGFAIEFWLLRRMGLEPLSWPGRLAGGTIGFLEVLLPALILTAITGQWADAPLLSWTIVAAAYGGAELVTPPLTRPPISNLLSWLWAIADEADLRRLIAWERRWYSHRVSIPVSGFLTLAMVLPLYVLGLHGSGVLAGTLYVGGFIVFGVMQNACLFFMVAPEAHKLSTCKYDLYLLSPADSVVVRKSLRGYNQLGALNVLLFTFLILLLLLLLPAGSGVVAPVVLSLLLLEYVATGVSVVVPRLMIERVIRVNKEEEMEILQARLNDLLPRLEKLTEEEYERMQRLQEAQDAIRDSPENLLPLGAILKTVGALLLSTATILVTAFAEEWIAWLVARFGP
jgi:hypothetical protein